ncbi:hypothetical protein M406DRAFT_18468, partial [Cryphonectria parasitica EP155]
PLLLTVRFSTSLPDLLLDIPHPRRTTVVALKHLIRSRLDQPDSQRRLRFIHGGKILPDAAVVASVLKPLPPPPLAAAQQQQHHGSSSPSAEKSAADPKGKGKAVEGSDPSRSAQLQQRVYVNCSIGDLLTDAELEDEARRAEEPVPEHVGSGGSTALHPGAGTSGAASMATPRGFDRLLAAGFTAAEVNQLRLQYRSITEARHTADTMPSPDTLRGMEDAWMDNNNDAGLATADGAGGGGDAAAAAAAADDFGMAGMLDLLLRGMFVGFVWPLGAVGWLVRDEEKIPKRMRVFVYFGFALSLIIGTI